MPVIRTFGLLPTIDSDGKGKINCPSFSKNIDSRFTISSLKCQGKTRR